MTDIVTITELERQVTETLGPEGHLYDVAAIAAELDREYDVVGVRPSQSITGKNREGDIPDEDYWRIVAKYERPPITVTLPGAFLGWFDGTGLAHGQDIDGPECEDRKLLFDLWTNTPVRRVGRGSFMRLEFPATRAGLEALDVLVNHAQTGVDATLDDPDAAGELAASRKVLSRAMEALRALEERLGAPKARLTLMGIDRPAW